MLRIPLLRNLLILSLAIAIVVPWYEHFFVHPAYKSLLIEVTESEAVRYASNIVRSLGLENQLLVKDRLPAGLEKSLQPANRDKRLIMLRIFSAQGEIIFSTQAAEIGELNDKDYFRKIVAKGQVYSKVVQKDHKTAEGELAQRDIVETYVPFMVDEAFGGAIEVYYDNTESVTEVKQLSLNSMYISLAMSLGFLLAISAALYRAYVSLLARKTAEDALRAAYEELELRVSERTQELSAANEQLTDQIAERTMAQTALSQALEESKVDREKLDVILRSVPDGVIVADNALNILHMNVAAEQILGMSLEKALGQSIATLNPEENFIKKVDQRLNLTQRSQPFDFTLPGEGSKSRRTYQVRVSQFIFDESESPGVVLLIRDVTREREIERMKSAFLNMATHELNTPLTTIIGYTELLTSEDTAGNFDAQQQKDFLLLIHNKALALGGLVDDLLDVSRVESGRPMIPRYSEFDLEAMIRDVVTTFRKNYTDHNFGMLFPAEAAWILADPLRLEQVVFHLVSNAVKYSPGGGEVHVNLVLQNDRYLLTVEDQGIGMNEEHLAHIFDRFYRADSSDTAVQGVGLGMSIVRNIVQAHHGEIRVESKLGHGTKVCVTLPLKPPFGYDESPQPFSS